LNGSLRYSCFGKNAETMTTPYRRKDNALYNIQQRFGDENIPFCPVCGSEDPHWLIAENQMILFKSFYYKCQECGSILATTEEDVCGLSRTDKTFAGKLKQRKGKELDRIYMKIYKLGPGITDIDRIAIMDKEMIIEDLLAAGKTLEEKRKKEKDS